MQTNEKNACDAIADSYRQIIISQSLDVGTEGINETTKLQLYTILHAVFKDHLSYRFPLINNLLSLLFSSELKYDLRTDWHMSHLKFSGNVNIGRLIMRVGPLGFVAYKKFVVVLFICISAINYNNKQLIAIIVNKLIQNKCAILHQKKTSRSQLLNYVFLFLLLSKHN